MTKKSQNTDKNSRFIPKNSLKKSKLSYKKLWHAIGNPLCSKNIFFKPKYISLTTMAQIKPLHDRVIVKAAEAETKTAGGIIIPDTAKEKPQKGTVVAAGPGKKDEPMTVKPGDTVLFSKYAGTEITVDGDDVMIMRESDILAIL